MKTRNIYSGLVMTAAALLCLAGCKKDEEGEKIMLGTQFEKAVSAQKTYLGENNTVCWNTNDSVFVNGVKYKGISSDGIAVTEDEHYYAVYPAVDGNSVGESGGSVVIPASQTYTLDEQSNKQVLNGPMAARLDGKSGTLYFRNLYSLLKVTVSADDKAFTVNSITVTATETNAKALAGTYSFSFEKSQKTGKTDSVSINEDANTNTGSTTVTLTCGSDNTVSANDDKDFYLVVHPLTTAQKLTVKVNGVLDGKRVVYTYNTASARTLNRSCIGGLGINLQQLTAEPIRFSIAEGKYVTFSPGNLQWSATNGGSELTTHAVAGDGTADGTWRFAEHQWDYVGDAANGTVSAGGVKSNNALIASNYTGWIDLFGWGTSGWNNGNTFYQPYVCSNASTTPYTSSKGYGYGPTNGTSYTFDLTCTYKNSDWGVYNEIQSFDGNTIYPKGTWRTLTGAEWAYLLGVSGKGRSNGHTDWWIYNMVTITDVGNAGVTGLIIYPDGVTAKPDGLPETSTKNNNTAVAITKANFEKLEALGCVFLPTTGCRGGTSVNNAGSFGYYWSSTCRNSDCACYLYFRSGAVDPSINNARYLGLSVRLVKDIE